MGHYLVPAAGNKINTAHYIGQGMQFSILNTQHPHLSIDTEQSTVSTRRRYLLKKKLSGLSLPNTPHSSNNIFTLTADTNHSYSEIQLPNNSYATIAESVNYCSRVVSPRGRDLTVELNPEKKLTLPVITESKYNFRPVPGIRKVKQRAWHERDPKYVQDQTTHDARNLDSLRRYQRIWREAAQKRSEKSLLEHSVEKSEKYVKKHNVDVSERRMKINFQTMLRDRNVQEAHKIGEEKGIPRPQIGGLKGRGGSVRSIFEQMFRVEEVYKCDK